MYINACARTAPQWVAAPGRGDEELLHDPPSTSVAATIRFAMAIAIVDLVVISKRGWRGRWLITVLMAFQEVSKIWTLVERIPQLPAEKRKFAPFPPRYQIARATLYT